jgi:hypothetical protein
MTKQWQYLVMTAGDMQRLHPNNGKLKMPAQEALQRALDLLGSRGWELVAIDQDTMYFKCEKD